MKLIPDIIRSRANPKIKWAAALKSKKDRTASRSFIAEGRKLSEEALSRGLPVTHIFILEEKLSELSAMLDKYKDREKFNDTEIIVVSEEVFNKISTEKSPEGIITVIKYLDFLNITDIIYKEEFFLKTDKRALALCSVRDPGNLGAVIRSATAFGVDAILISEDCADIYNPKTVRASMGSLFGTEIAVVKNLRDFISHARECGRRVFAAELSESAISLGDLDVRPTDIFVIGNEGHGIPREVSEVCERSVYIPISKKTESLNAAVAAAVFMWEQSK